MNRETRRMIEREERLQKNKEKSEGGRAAAGRAAAGRAAAARAQGGGTAGGVKEAAPEKKSLFRRLSNYLHEVRVEMRKVSWPTSEQMIVFTTVTMITSVALTFLIFGLDFGLKNMVLWVIDGGIRG